MTRPLGIFGSLEKRDIILVPYDSSWPQKFQYHYERICAALGSRALHIEHIGSTSVPHLIAKPIIDIDLTVADTNDEDQFIPQLLSAGYELRVREIGHLMVRTPTLDTHIHICNPHSNWERRHLLFRDWLRHDEDDRMRYAECKKQLATQDWPDMNAYAAAKTATIHAITERAEQWANTGWNDHYHKIVASYMK